MTDILLWADCYATMVSVLVEKYPCMAQGFMAYLRTILKANRTFQGDAWVTYNMTYHRREANQSSLDWGVISKRAWGKIARVPQSSCVCYRMLRQEITASMPIFSFIAMGAMLCPSATVIQEKRMCDFNRVSPLIQH